MPEQRPFVIANFAITADGRISTRKKTPSDFSSPRDKRRLLEIRAAADAVLASARTIRADRMTMGLPAEDLRAMRSAEGRPAYPQRVVLTQRGRLDPALPIFAHAFSPIIIFSTTRMPKALRAQLAAKATLHLAPGGTVDLHAMMRTLHAEHRIERLVCEGGAQVFRSLLEAGLVDELNLTLCPRIFGGRAAPTLTGVAGVFLPKSIRMELCEMLPIDSECFLRYRLRR
jgi:riboflavin-specific deaminase-like protein